MRVVFVQCAREDFYEDFYRVMHTTAATTAETRAVAPVALAPLAVGSAVVAFPPVQSYVSLTIIFHVGTGPGKCSQTPTGSSFAKDFIFESHPAVSG